MQPSKPFKKHPLTIALQACAYTILGASPLAVAAPTGGAVVGGSGTIAQSGTATTINQATQNLAINWQSFDVAANERVQFIQPNSSAIALNRILSNNGSTIAGRIDSNGRVILVNPNGVFFTSTAVLNVGSIIASGLDINPANFMNGNYIFNEIPGSSGAVINNGMINASLGGNVALIGKYVENNGLIVANLGTVTLAAGKQTVLTFDNGGLLGVRVSQEILQNELGVDPAVINSGEIQAQGGRVLLTASQSQDVFSRAVNTTGLEPATSVVVNDDGTFTLGGADVLNSGTINTSSTGANQNGGRIVLLGNNVTSSGTLRADAQSGNGGEIELHARDTALLTQNSITSARSESNGNGGIVKVLGDKVGLFDQSTVDVSGANGGGQALIGGDYQGKNANIRNASRTYVSTGSTTHADALLQGNGGKIINWANDYTWFYGNAFARGGSAGGDGGLVEISGKGLSFDGRVDTSAVNGAVGTLLFDPVDIRIVAGSGGTTVLPLNPPSGTSSLSATTAGTPTELTIDQNNLQNISANTNIILQANNDITIENLNAGGSFTTTLDLNTAAGHSVTFTADSDNDGAGNFSMRTSDTIQTNGGSVIIQGANVTTGNIDTTGSSGNTTGGNINITSTNSNIAVRSLTTAVNASGAGNIDLNAYGGSVTLNNAAATNGGYFSATTNNSTVTGGGAGTYFDNSGGNASINTGSGSVTINTVGADGSARGANLGSITAGSLAVTTSGGRIDQSTSTASNLDITGSASFNANGNSINLLNASNNLQGAVTLTTTGANDATLINNATTTTLGTVTVGGIVRVTADRHLTLSGAVAAGSMNLFFGDGGLDSTFTTSPNIALTGAVSVVGGGGDDTFNIGSMFTGTVNGNGGANTLRGPDAASNNQNGWVVNSPNGGTLAQSGTNAPATGTVSFTDIQNLSGGSGVDTFTVGVGGYVSGYIDGGGAPALSIDSVNLSAVTGDTSVQLLTSAPATPFNNTANQFTLYRIGSVTANAANNTLGIVGTASPNQWAITGTNSGSANSTAFAGFNRLIGDTGVDNFVFGTLGTLNDINGIIIGRINGGGGPGINTLTVNGASTSTIILGQGNFSVGGSTQVGYANIADVTANGGASIAVNNTNIAGTLTLANTGSVTSAGLTAGTLVLNGVGQFGASTQALNTTIGGLSVLNSGPVYLNNTSTGTLTLGPITTASLIDITAAGAVGNNAALVSTAPLTVRSAGNIDLTNAGNALSNIHLSVTGPSGGTVSVVNNGTLTASITTLGNINLTNNGNLIIDRLYTNGGIYLPLPSGPYTGDVRLTVNGGGIAASRANTTNGPDIVAQNLTVRVLGGEFGTRARPMSLRVHDTFSYLGGRGHWQPYGADPRVFDDVNRSLSRFSSLGRLDGLRLLEIESLDEFDPAIFTEIRNYYYEDVAIMIPAEQQHDGSDEEEKEEEKKGKL